MMKQGKVLYGGDYNPEQWLERPDILEKDIEYMKAAGINTVTVGMFACFLLAIGRFYPPADAISATYS